MRKSFILALLMLMLAVAFIASASGRINEARDDVTFEETVLHGNRSAADGLALELHIHSDYRLFWDTSYIFDAEPEISTDFSFSQSRKYQTMEYEYHGISFTINANVSASTNGSFDFDGDDHIEIYGLLPIYRDVASRTLPGKEHAEAIYLSDYFDFYPISIGLDLPVYWKEAVGDYSNIYMDDDTGNNSGRIYEKLNEIFKIPVADDDELEVRISKNSAGEVYSYESHSIGKSINCLWSISVQTKGGCYFTFNSRASDGTAYDTSHISPGYGIYYLPYEEEEGNLFVSSDSLSMVYELIPGTEIIELIANDEQSQLLLMTIENEKCVLTVIDIATMNTIQRLELFDHPNDAGMLVYPYEDFWVLESKSFGKLAVVSLQGTGEYRLDFITQLSDEQSTDLILYGSHVMAYDGERLAIVGYGDLNSYRYYTPSFYVSIYDQSGLAYLGHYKSSLAVGRDMEYPYICRSIDNEPISVRWKS